MLVNCILLLFEFLLCSLLYTPEGPGSNHGPTELGTTGLASLFSSRYGRLVGFLLVQML